MNLQLMAIYFNHYTIKPIKKIKMILNNDTVTKVASLLKIPVNTVEYNGSYGSNVNFLIGVKNSTNDWQSGVCISVNENFEIKQVERIKITQGRFTRNYPIRKFILPIYSTIN